MKIMPTNASGEARSSSRNVIGRMEVCTGTGAALRSTGPMAMEVMTVATTNNP